MQLRQSLVGNFNAWDGRRHPMQRLDTVCGAYSFLNWKKALNTSLN